MVPGSRKLLIVDDEEQVHRGLRCLLEKDYEITSAMSGEEALVLARQHEYPVVILDLCMGGISGVDTLRVLKARNASQQVIILTGHACLENSRMCLNLGAFQYLLKPEGVGELPPLVVEAFQRYARNTHLRTQRDISLDDLRAFGLARREAEVALLRIRNMNNSEIAALLDLSVRTVEKHARFAFEKLGLPRRRGTRAKIVE